MTFYSSLFYMFWISFILRYWHSSFKTTKAEASIWRRARSMTAHLVYVLSFCGILCDFFKFRLSGHRLQIRSAWNLFKEFYKMVRIHQSLMHEYWNIERHGFVYDKSKKTSSEFYSLLTLLVSWLCKNPFSSELT